MNKRRDSTDRNDEERVLWRWERRRRVLFWVVGALLLTGFVMALLR